MNSPGTAPPRALFDPTRHEPLSGQPWSDDAAQAAIARIAAAAEAEFDAARGGWKAHPLDDGDAAAGCAPHLYSGAAGVIWALRDLAAQGAIDLHIDFSDCIAGLAERATANAAEELHGSASYLLGSAGALLLQWSVTRDAAVADTLFDLVQGNMHNTAREALWGNSGTVLAAIHMAEATGEVRWLRLVQQCVQVLLDEMEISDETGTWVWVQDLYGKVSCMLGAGHGFVGNVYPAFRAEGLLDASTAAMFHDRALQTLSASAWRDGALTNWHPYIDGVHAGKRLPLVQDCHGAPGVVCRLASAPRSAEWDELLLSAGELTWTAGPLTKGASICHGTPGSALACLKLWRRFKDPLWLDRARAMAMHCVDLVERHRAQYGMGRHSLWTGDLGVACLLWNCVARDDRFPTLDHF